MKTNSNKICLTGTLGKDPIIKIFENGGKKAILILATKDKHLNSSGREIWITRWQKVIAWGKTADQVERMLHKGSKVSIEGNLREYKILLKDYNYKMMTDIMLNQFEVHLDIPNEVKIRA
jgi:single-strand DNA-binding protein